MNDDAKRKYGTVTLSPPDAPPSGDFMWMAAEHVTRAEQRAFGTAAHYIADLVPGQRWPKRRLRVIGGETVKVVIPKRIRMGLEQKPHPHIALAAERRRQRRTIEAAVKAGWEIPAALGPAVAPGASECERGRAVRAALNHLQSNNQFARAAAKRGQRWPKRRLFWSDKWVLVVVPKRIRLGLDQRPHPHLAWAAEQRRARQLRAERRAEMKAAGLNPDDPEAYERWVRESFYRTLADVVSSRTHELGDLVSHNNAFLLLLNRK